MGFMRKWSLFPRNGRKMLTFKGDYTPTRKPNLLQWPQTWCFKTVALEIRSSLLTFSHTQWNLTSGMGEVITIIWRAVVADLGVHKAVVLANREIRAHYKLSSDTHRSPRHF